MNSVEEYLVQVEFNWLNVELFLVIVEIICNICHLLKPIVTLFILKHALLKSSNALLTNFEQCLNRYVESCFKIVKKIEKSTKFFTLNSGAYTHVFCTPPQYRNPKL